MSIATLKKKTQAKYNNMSVNSTHGFSLNGTHRNQGYVGQTSLSRSLPRTLMKGNVIKGHGGCCGTYNVTPIVQSGVISQENPNVVKSSVINTRGMIEEYINVLTNVDKPDFKTCPNPFNTVKPDVNSNLNSQHDHIKNVAKAAIKCDKNNNANKSCLHVQSCANMSTKNYSNINANLANYAKPESKLSAISQGKYLLALNNKCIDNEKKNINPSNNTPLPTGS
jgi:hypothetical protein